MAAQSGAGVSPRPELLYRRHARPLLGVIQRPLPYADVLRSRHQSGLQSRRSRRPRVRLHGILTIWVQRSVEHHINEALPTMMPETDRDSTAASSVGCGDDSLHDQPDLGCHSIPQRTWSFYTVIFGRPEAASGTRPRSQCLNTQTQACISRSRYARTCTRCSGRQPICLIGWIE